MARRGVPVALVLTAAAADGLGAHGLAFYALLAAVPAAAVAALDAFGDSLAEAGNGLHALLWAIVLALTVTGAAVRAPLLAQGTVPALGRSAVVACLAIFCLQAVLGLVTELRRQ
jgi:hypothetical protein